LSSWCFLNIRSWPWSCGFRGLGFGLGLIVSGLGLGLGLVVLGAGLGLGPVVSGLGVGLVVSGALAFASVLWFQVLASVL